MNIKFKTHLVAAVSAVGIITALTACDPAEDTAKPDRVAEVSTATVEPAAPAPAPAYTAPATTEAPVELTDDDMEAVYLIVLDGEDVVGTDSTQIDMGKAVCNYLDTDPNPLAAALVIYNGGNSAYTAGQSGTIVGAAIMSFCDEYADLIPE